MPAPLAAFLACTYGTSELQLDTFEVADDPIVSADFGRLGDKWSVNCQGYLTGTDPADFAAKTAAALADLRTSGRNFVITGLSGATLFALAAAGVGSGGPHVKLTSAKPGGTPLRMDFAFTVTGETPQQGSPSPGGGPTPPTDGYKVSTKTREDGVLREVTRTGEVNGPDPVAYFLDVVRPQWRAAFPLPGWSVQGTYELAAGGAVAAGSSTGKVTYTLTAVQMAGVLPSGGGSNAVSGTHSIRVERDEQYRLTRVSSFDLVVDADPWSLVTLLRPDGTLRESVEVEVLRELSIRASFTTLASADAVPLMNYSESLQADEGHLTVYEVVSYPGAEPLIVEKPKGLQRVTQQGNAVCAGAYFAARQAISTARLEPDQVTYENLNDVEKRTSWRYVFYLDAGKRVPLDQSLEQFFRPPLISRQSLDLGPKSFKPA